MSNEDKPLTEFGCFIRVAGFLIAFFCIYIAFFSAIGGIAGILLTIYTSIVDFLLGLPWYVIVGIIIIPFFIVNLTSKNDK